jgi:hypothetical protein
MRKLNKQEESTKRYLLIELACTERQCDPCTYPDCPRFVRERRPEKAPFTIKTIAVQRPRDKLLDEKDKESEE